VAGGLKGRREKSAINRRETMKRGYYLLYLGIVGQSFSADYGGGGVRRWGGSGEETIIQGRLCGTTPEGLRLPSLFLRAGVASSFGGERIALGGGLPT